MINKDQIRRMLDIADIKTSARLMLLVVEIVELQVCVANMVKKWLCKN